LFPLENEISKKRRINIKLKISYKTILVDSISVLNR
jgi:hypothetical protein